MTREEKANAIEAYCDSTTCSKCKLRPFVGRENCYSEGADVDRNYSIIFGDPRESTSGVNHPAHYAGEKYECIEVMLEVFGADAVKHFCLLNAFKYLWRCGKKHESPYEDIAKAIWYLEKYKSIEKEKRRMENGE